jgi:large subunit ribosomal protein L25
MAKFEINAEKRELQGTGASRRLRRADKVPAILYGAGKSPQMLALDHETLYLNLKHEAFHTSILTVNVAGGEPEQAILRDVQMHPFRPRVQHLDLQRISATEKIHMRVPLHFLNAENAPGVKLEGGIVMHLMNEVDVTCLPKDLPEYLEVDLANLKLNESLHLKDIPLPAGVAITSLAHGGDNLAVVSISHVRVVEEEVAPVVEAAAPAEGAAPAAGAEAGKAEAGKPEAGKKEAAKPEAGKPAKKEGK